VTSSVRRAIHAILATQPIAPIAQHANRSTIHVVALAIRNARLIAAPVIAIATAIHAALVIVAVTLSATAKVINAIATATPASAATPTLIAIRAT